MHVRFVAYFPVAERVFESGHVVNTVAVVALHCFAQPGCVGL
jgi:hypothetical protein